MIQASVIQNTNYLMPNKEHKNFTASNENAREGTIINGSFKNVTGLRKGEPFVYRLFFVEDGKILYANCVQADNVPSEILSGVDNNKSVKGIETNSSKGKIMKAELFIISGALIGYLIGRNKKLSTNNLIKSSIVGAVGAYGIYCIIDKNKSTIKISNK